MKSRIVSLSLFVVATVLIAGSASGSAVGPEEQTAIAPVMDLELPLSPELEETSEVCASTPEADENSGKVEGLFKDLDQLLRDVEPVQVAFQCPGYFYAPTCADCLDAANRCYNEGELPAWQCGACYEICMCNKGCCS